MSKVTRTRVTNDGAKGFFDRSCERARKLDRNEPLTPETVIGFEDGAEIAPSPQTGPVRRKAVNRLPNREH